MKEAVLQAGEGLFWLSLTFLAILGVVTSLATNFIGKIKDSVESEKASRKAAYQKELDRVTDEIKNSQKLDGKLLSDAGTALVAKRGVLERHLRNLDKLSSVLQIDRAVILPGSFILACFILANIGKVAALPWAFFAVLLAFVLIVVAAFVSGKNILLLGAISELLSPKLSMKASCASSWKAGIKSKISVTTLLERGRSMHSRQVVLYVPPCFKSTASFVGKLKRPSDDYLMPNYETIASKDWPLLKMDLPSTYDFDKLSCNQTGQYKLYYRIVTEEYTSTYQEIDLEIVR